jgi:hypothetical protein
LLGFQDETVAVVDDDEEKSTSSSSSYGYKLVPWLNWNEWECVWDSLFSESPENILSAINRVRRNSISFSKLISVCCPSNWGKRYVIRLLICFLSVFFPPQLSRIIFNCFSSAVKTWNFIFNNSVVFIIVKLVTQLPIECFYLLFLVLIEFMYLWFRYLHGEAEGVYLLWLMSQLRSLKFNRRILCIGNSLFPVSMSWCPRSCFKRFAWFSACASCWNYNGNASSSASARLWCYECYNCVFLE